MPADPATDYAVAVVDRRELANRWVTAACRRHLDDLEKGAGRGLVWDLEKANRIQGYFRDVLVLTGGPEGVGKPFVPHSSQAFILGSLFGWCREDGFRRFRAAYVEQAKGSGKSPMGAGIGTYMLAADGEIRAECYAAAVDKDQAKIPFRDAVAMVRASPQLAKRITFSGGPGNEWQMTHVETGSFFRPLSSESSGRGKSGPRVHYALLDEVHEHPSPAMVEWMRAGTKNRDQALVLLITNSGVDRTSVCRAYHDYAIGVSTGRIDNDAFYGYVCGLDACESCAAEGAEQPRLDCDDCDDWRDPKVWRKANPLLDVSVSTRYVAEQVREAEGMPSKLNTVLRLNFCLWTETAENWISFDVWAANGGAADVGSLEGRECWGGLDLSGKNDLTALHLEFPLDDGTFAELPFYWTPADTLREREDLDRAPYLQWVREGRLIAVPGKTIEYDRVARLMGDLVARYRIRSVAFDPWRIDDLKRELDRAGVEVNLAPHGQGFKDVDPAIEGLEDDLLNGRLRHGMHPVLTMCSANAAVEENAGGMRRFSKQRSRGRIDGVVAMAMANSARRRAAETVEPEYRMFFVG